MHGAERLRAIACQCGDDVGHVDALVGKGSLNQAQAICAHERRGGLLGGEEVVGDEAITLAALNRAAQEADGVTTGDVDACLFVCGQAVKEEPFLCEADDLRITS